MTNLAYLIVALSILVLILINTRIFYSIMRIRHKNIIERDTLVLESKKLEFEKRKLDLEMEIDEMSFGLLDIFIQKCIDNYLVMNPKYGEMVYINSEEQTNLNKGVNKKVVDEMSESFYNRLTVIYEIDKLASIIAERVYIRTMYYIVEKNKTKK